MSTNVLEHDNSNKQIKEQRQCANPTGENGLSLYDFTNSHDDACYLAEQTKQSIGPGNYNLSNHYHCEKDIPKVVEIATNIPQVFFKNGHGIDNRNVDESTDLRWGKARSNPRCRDQLHERPYKSVPYMGRGGGNSYLETQILPGEPTREKRQCNTLSGVTIDNYFTPMIDHLKENIQSPSRIIPEEVHKGWIRGGAPSRLIVQDLDYYERCSKKYMDKVANDEFWQDKHRFL